MLMNVSEDGSWPNDGHSRLQIRYERTEIGGIDRHDAVCLLAWPDSPRTSMLLWLYD